MTSSGPPENDLARIPLTENPEDLYEHAPCGYASLSADDLVIKANQTLLRWIGRQRHDVIGHMRLTDLLTAGSRIYYETHIRPTLNGRGSISEVAVDLRSEDGPAIPALLNATLVRDDDGQPLVTRVSVIDATMRREYERELLRARRQAEESEARARELARTLQASLLPPSLPDIPGVEIASAYHPGGEGSDVGGDFYDVFPAADGEWIVALGDVSGKGSGAAAVTGLARYTIRAAAITTRQPSEMLQQVNTVLTQDQTDRFCTAVCARLTPMDDGRLQVTLALGGHSKPLHVSRQDVQPVGRLGRLLGLFESSDLHDSTLVLERGEGLLLHTDGLQEARRGRAFLGDAAVRSLVHDRRHQDAQRLVEGLAQAAVDFQERRPRDDIAILYVRVP